MDVRRRYANACFASMKKKSPCQFSKRLTPEPLLCSERQKTKQIHIKSDSFRLCYEAW